jgi:hypothetical protein
MRSLTSVQDKHGLKMPDPKHAYDHSTTTARKRAWTLEYATPVSLLWSTNGALRFIESPSFQKVIALL